jgi:hypothetical protein
MYIFISYTGKDSKRSEDIQEKLNELKIEHFAFESAIRPGQSIREEVLNAIKRATHLIIIISESAKESKWIWYEVGFATGISQFAHQGITVIPYKADTTVEIPDFLNNIRYLESLKDLKCYFLEEQNKKDETMRHNIITYGDNLNFYGFETSIKMIDFCITGYNPKDVHIQHVRAVNRKPPKNLVNIFNIKKDEWEQKKAKKEIYDNNDLIGLQEYTIIRKGIEENQALEFKVFNGSYVHHRGAVEVFRDLSSDKQRKILKQAVQTRPLHGGHRFFGNIIAVSVTLITSDKKIVFQKRSRNVAIDPGLIMCGIGEGMKEDDLRGDDNNVIGLFKTTVRGLREEFGIEVQYPMKCLKLTAFCLNRELFEWYVLGTFDLSKAGSEWDEQHITEQHIKTNQPLSKDSFEIDNLYFVPYTPEKVFDFLRTMKNEMVNYGIAAAICSMASDWGISNNYLSNCALNALKNCAREDSK